jgi:quercetin dioxygenase-like cupin family protein
MGDLVWQAVLDGGEMAVLHGDPTQSGEYVIRFRTDREIFVPLHWHQHDEHITVVSGPFSLSLDDSRSALAAGSDIMIPATVRHSAWYGEGTVVEVSGVGPFESIYVDPGDASGLAPES